MKKNGFFNSLNKCYVIAEIGVNHNGDINLAEKMIYEAKSAGADAVKFQSFHADQLASKILQRLIIRLVIQIQMNHITRC